MLTNNYYTILNNALFGSKLKLTKSNGVREYYNHGVGTYWSNGDRYYGFYSIGTLLTSYEGQGVILGNGDTPAAPEDYKLAGDIVSGYSANGTITHFFPETKDTGKYERNATYTLINNTKNPMIIKEMAYLFEGIVLDRTVLERPLEIAPNGGIGKITYTLINKPLFCNEPTNIDIDSSDVYTLVRDDISGGYTWLGGCTNFDKPIKGESSPFDNIAPWKDMLRYNLVDNTIGACETSENFDPLKETVVYIPEFYYHYYIDHETCSSRWSISATPREGYVKHPGSDRYVSRYFLSQDESGILTSISGKAPLSDSDLATYRKVHDRNKNIWMIDIATYSAIRLLAAIETKSWNLYDFFGAAYNNHDWWKGTISIPKTGMTDITLQSYHTGQLSDGQDQYRWIENLYATTGTAVDGVKVEGHTLHYSFNNAEFTSDSPTYSTGSVQVKTSGDLNKFAYALPTKGFFIPGVSSYDNKYNYSGGANTKMRSEINDGEGIRFGSPYVGKNSSSDDYKRYKSGSCVPIDAGTFSSSQYDGASAQRCTRLIYIPDSVPAKAE